MKALALAALLAASPGFLDGPREGGWLAPDKQLHVTFSAGLDFGANLMLSACTTAFCTSLSPLTRALLPMGATLAVGVGKEIWDRAEGGIFSRRDLVADLAGIIVTQLLWEGVKRIGAHFGTGAQ